MCCFISCIDDVVNQLPDLCAQALYVDPAHTTLQDTVILAAIIKNYGSMPSGPFSASFTTSNDDSTFYFSIPSLDSGQTYTIKKYKYYEDTTFVNVYLHIDVKDSVHESDESNNGDTISYQVYYGSIPDLGRQALSANPGSPTINDTVILTALVKNFGTVSSGPFTASFTTSNDDSTFYYSIPSLDTGQYYTIKKYKYYQDTASVNVYLNIDVYDSVAEASESNNKDTINYIVSPAPLPDLTTYSLKVNPAAPTTKDTVIINAQLVNLSSASCGPSIATMKTSNDDSIFTFAIPSLTPGKVHFFQKKKVYADSATVNVYVTLDVYDSITESNENNNRDTISYSVSNNNPPGIDLVVDTINYTPANPTTTDSIDLTCTIQNIGTKSSQVPCKGKMQVGPFTYIVIDIPALASQQKHSHKEKILIDEVGTWSVSVKADDESHISETNENNNTKAINITVTQ